jgi:hypothetical protein
MTVRIRNLLVSGPLLVPLSSGGTVRLSPGQVTDELADAEIANNAKIEKLRAQQVIDVEQTGASADEKTADEKTEAEPEADAATGGGDSKTSRRSNRSR